MSSLQAEPERCPSAFLLGQLGSLPWDLSDVSSREHQGGEIHEAFLLDLPDPRTPLARVTFSLCPGAGERPLSSAARSANDLGRGCGFPRHSQDGQRRPVCLCVSTSSADCSLTPCHSLTPTAPGICSPNPPPPPHPPTPPPSSTLGLPVGCFPVGLGPSTCHAAAQAAPGASRPSSLLSSTLSRNAWQLLKCVPSFCLSSPGLGLVFIHLESSHYSLPCSPAKMEVADPGYQWEQDRAGEVPAPPRSTVGSKRLP